MKKELTRKEFNMLVFLHKTPGAIFRNLRFKTDHYIMQVWPDVK